MENLMKQFMIDLNAMRKASREICYCHRCDEKEYLDEAKPGYEVEADGTEISYKLTCAYCIQEIAEANAHSRY